MSAMEVRTGMIEAASSDTVGFILRIISFFYHRFLNNVSSREIKMNLK